MEGIALTALIVTSATALIPVILVCIVKRISMIALAILAPTALNAKTSLKIIIATATRAIPVNFSNQNLDVHFII